MIVGTGIDIVEIARMTKAIEQHGDSFAKKILSDNEMEQYQESNFKVAYLAKRFAVKEAFLKAIGTGMRGDFSFRNICIDNDELGKPFVNNIDAIKQCALPLIIDQIHISISDEKAYAVAIVILETNN